MNGPSARQQARRASARSKVGRAPASGDKARSLARGLAILEFIRNRRERPRAGDVIRALGLPRASAYQILSVLAREGFLTVDPQDHGYSIGIQAYRLGIAYQSQRLLLREAPKILRRLRDDAGETAQLSVLDRDMNLVVQREDGPGRLTLLFPVGSYTPVNWSASGSLLVSDWSEDELHARLPGMIRPSPTGVAPTELAVVASEIRRFRSQGYAIRIGAAHAKVATIAAPVTDATGRCVAAVTLFVYEPALIPARRRALIPMVVTAAKDLSARIREA